MKGRSYLLGAALVSGLAMSATMSTPASAADILEPVPPPAPVLLWRGPYLGGFVSGHWGDVETDISDDVDIDGILGGVIGGWNFQVGPSWVFGVEGDFDWGEIDGDEGCGPGCEIDDFDIHQAGHARGRIGWAGFSPNVLLFVAGGAAFAEGQLRVVEPGFGGFDEQWHVGWTVGGGLDWRVTPHIVLRVEYLFDSLGSEDYDTKAGKVDVDIDQLHTVRGAVMWHF